MVNKCQMSVFSECQLYWPVHQGMVLEMAWWMCIEVVYLAHHQCADATSSTSSSLFASSKVSMNASCICISLIAKCILHWEVDTSADTGRQGPTYGDCLVYSILQNNFSSLKSEVIRLHQLVNGAHYPNNWIRLYFEFLLLSDQTSHRGQMLCHQQLPLLLCRHCSSTKLIIHCTKRRCR